MGSIKRPRSSHRKNLGIADRGHEHGYTDDVPSQVRIRTDDGNEPRYETIQKAKEVFDEGNNTAAILAACRHARHDRRAKQKALDHPDMTPEFAEVLSTPLMELEYRVETAVRTD